MILDSLKKINIFQILLKIDSDLAQLAQSKKCPFCGASLHQSNYLRKPRGGPPDLPQEFLIRHSFCCSKENCRKRTLPISLRFLNRKVYFRGVILVVLTLKQGRSKGYSAGKLIRLTGISRSTLKRWMIWFKQVFPVSSLWQKLKGRLRFHIASDSLPQVVVHYFIKQSKSEEDGLIQTMQFLSGGFEMI